jgi:hypothetical protein
MLNVICAERHKQVLYAECRYAEFRYAVCRGAHLAAAVGVTKFIAAITMNQITLGCTT